MAFIKIDTNVPISDINENFFTLSTDSLASTLKKPKSDILVLVNADLPIIFGGSEEPAAFVSISSVGGINAVDNKKHSAALFPLLQKYLKVNEDRISISFNAVEPHNAGSNGKTYIQ